MDTQRQNEPAGLLISPTTEEYKTLLESFAQAFWETDAAGQVVTDSPSWRAYTGQTLKQWLGEGWTGAVHPDDRTYALSQWQQAVGQRVSVNTEFRLQSPQGGWRWTNVRATPILNPDGSVKKWLGINIDISAKKEAEEALRQIQQQQQAQLEATVTSRTAELAASQQLLQATLDSSLDMIQVFDAVHDESGQIIDFTWVLNNQPAQKVYGDVIGKRLLTLNPGVVEAGIFDTFKRVIETGLSDQSEYHYVHEQFEGWFFQSTVKMGGGVATTTTDITNRKQAEQQLQQSKELQEAVFNTVRHAIVVFETIRNEAHQPVDFRYILSNGVADHHMGIPTQGKTIRTLIPGYVDEANFATMIDVVETGQPANKVLHFTYGSKPIYLQTQYLKLNDGVVLVHEDITERRKVEEEILRLKDEVAQKAEEKYQAIFNSINEGFSLLDIQFDEHGNACDVIIRDANPAQDRIDGVRALIGKRVREILPDIDMAWIERYAAVARGGEPINFEDWSEANQRWYKVHASRVGGQGSTLVAIVYDDITDRKRNEEQQKYLLKLSDALRPLADPVAIQAVSADLLGEHLKANQAHYGEVIGEYVHIHHSYGNGLPPMTGKFRHYDFGERLVDGYRTGKVQVCYDTTTDPAISETERNVLRSAHIGAYIAMPLVKNNEWVVTLAVHTMEPRQWEPYEIDLVEETAERTWAAVERAQAEEALRKSEERFRLLVMASSDSVYEMSPDWMQMHQLVGKTFLADTRAPSSSWLQAYIPADAQWQVQQVIQQAIRAKSNFELEHRVLRADGTVGWTFSRAIPVLDEQGAIREWLGAASDITLRKQAEEDRRVADQRKDEFLAMLAHELRNPMATIRNGLQILTMIPVEDELIDSTVAMMNRQTNYLVRLVDDLLDVSRISQGKIELRKERVNLVELVAQAVEAARFLYQERERSLHVTLPASPIYLVGDATRLTQVVANLLTNGVRYTGSGGQVWLRLEHKTGPTFQQEAIIRVRDNGIGLAADQLEAIFDLFVQVDNSLARSQGGLGLGLTLVKRLVDMHGGRVEAQSAGLGQGSIFTVYLPTLSVYPDFTA